MNTRHLIRIAGAWLAAAALAACGAPAAPSSAPAPSKAVLTERAAGAAPGQSDASAPTANGAQRLIIRTATLTLVVTDTAEQLKAITKLVEDAKGYVASSGTTKLEQGLRAEISVRVPADQLNPVLEKVRGLAVEVRDERITGQDVTEEYVDVGARLTNLEAAEAQLRDILSKATKTEDVLNVFRQLTEVRGQIEQLKGRKQYLETSAAMATISLSLIPDKLAQPVAVPGWRAEGIAKQAIEALVVTLQALASAGIWFVIYLAPLIVLVTAPITLLILALRRASRRRGAQRPAAPPKA